MGSRARMRSLVRHGLAHCPSGLIRGLRSGLVEGATTCKPLPGTRGGIFPPCESEPCESEPTLLCDNVRLNDIASTAAAPAPSRPVLLRDLMRRTCEGATQQSCPSPVDTVWSQSSTQHNSTTASFQRQYGDNLASQPNWGESAPWYRGSIHAGPTGASPSDITAGDRSQWRTEASSLTWGLWAPLGDRGLWNGSEQVYPSPAAKKLFQGQRQGFMSPAGLAWHTVAGHWRVAAQDPGMCISEQPQCSAEAQFNSDGQRVLQRLDLHQPAADPAFFMAGTDVLRRSNSEDTVNSAEQGPPSRWAASCQSLSILQGWQQSMHEARSAGQTALFQQHQRAALPCTAVLASQAQQARRHSQHAGNEAPQSLPPEPPQHKAARGTGQAGNGGSQPKNWDWSQHGWTARDVLSAANVVSLARLLSGPPIAWLILSGYNETAMLALAAAAASDWLDGALARATRGSRSSASAVLGSYLDPLADKVLVACVAVALWHSALLPSWLVLLVVARDMALLSAAFLQRARALDWKWASWGEFFRVSSGGADTMQPLLISKANTALQMLLLPCALFQAHPAVEPFFEPLCFAVALATLGSWFGYFWRHLAQGRARAVRP